MKERRQRTIPWATLLVIAVAVLGVLALHFAPPIGAAGGCGGG